MFYIYDKDTSQILEIVRHRPYKRTERYKTMSAAKAALTRYNKKWAEKNDKLGNEADSPQFTYGIAECEYYHKHIEKMVERVNMMTGKKYMESINTPRYCSPSSEAYWSM